MPVENNVAAGDELAGRYVVQETLGRGTMAVVVSAKDRVTNEIVACKIPLDDTPYKVEGLLGQRLLLQKLRSPHLQSVPLVQQHRSANADFKFLVFDVVDGDCLSAWMLGRTLRERLAALGAIAQTVDLLASEGAAHGDLNADNIIVHRSTGRIVLIDPEGTSFGRSRASSGVPSAIGGPMGTAAKEDVAGLVGLADALVQESERSVARHLFGEISSSSPKQIAASIRFLLSLPHLPGDHSFGVVAADYRTKVAADRKLFLEIAQQRHLAFEQTCDVIRALLDTLGCTSAEWALAGSAMDFLRSEIETADKPEGQLFARSIQARSPLGATLVFTLYGGKTFRRPWPYAEREGLVDTGAIAVHFGPAPALIYDLELWYRSDGFVLCVAGLGDLVALGPDHLERLMRVVAEEILPGVARPETIKPKPRVSFLGPVHAELDTFQRWCKSRKKKAPAFSDKEFLPSFLEMALCADVYSHFRRQVRPHLRTFFEVPKTHPHRLQAVQQAAREFMDVFGEAFSPLRRLDVRSDDSRGVLRVDFDGGKVRHSFEADVRTWQMVFAERKANAGDKPTRRTSPLKKQSKPRR